MNNTSRKQLANVNISMYGADKARRTEWTDGHLPSRVDREDGLNGATIEHAAAKQILDGDQGEDDAGERLEMGTMPQCHGCGGHRHCMRETP